jgi:hypothetical protein
LAAERAKLLTAVESLSPAELVQPHDGGWSVKDILAHITNAEKVNVKFARLMLETDTPVQLDALAADYPDYVGAFELDRFNAYMFGKLRDEPPDRVLDSLTAVRAATIGWLETLTPDQLDRTGEHAAWGEQTVRGMVKILVVHDKMHAQEIMKRGQVRK